MLPTVDFCGLNVTRLVIGANPFAGYSHQNAERDREMLSYSTPARIMEAWERAAAAGINTMVTNNTAPHVVQSVTEYLASGGPLQWIAQVRGDDDPGVLSAIDEAVEIGSCAVYFHGAMVDDLFMQRDSGTLRRWCGHVRSHGIPAGVAAHAPAAHLWVDGLGIADFHAVCFFNCGSVHDGRGEKFRLSDVFRAASTVRSVSKPCLAYKIMGAGRIEPRLAFEYAFSEIKPSDAVNVGMHRGDRDDMVEMNAAIVEDILQRS